VVFLEESGWDVERALRRWRRCQRSETTGSDNEDSDSSAEDSSDDSDATASNTAANTAYPQRVDLRAAMQAEDLPYNVNIEHERRETVVAFSKRIRERHSVALTIAEAVLLLNREQWDLGMALTLFVTYAEARDRLRVQFDGTRDNTENENEQSFRLVTLIEITERADWLSMKVFLMKKKWNLVRVVVAWFKKGIRPFNDDDVRAGGFVKDRPHWAKRIDANGNLRPMPLAADCLPVDNTHWTDWADDTADFTNAGDSDPPVPIKHGDRVGRAYGGTRRDPGYIIHAGANSTVKPGPPDLSKLFLEYISKGVYRYNLFSHKKYWFSERVPDFGDSADDDSSDDDDSQDGRSGAVVRGLNMPQSIPFAEFDFGTQSRKFCIFFELFQNEN
jgi:hypothetical protein